MSLLKLFLGSRMLECYLINKVRSIAKGCLKGFLLRLVRLLGDRYKWDLGWAHISLMLNSRAHILVHTILL